MAQLINAIKNTDLFLSHATVPLILISLSPSAHPDFNQIYHHSSECVYGTDFSCFMRVGVLLLLLEWSCFSLSSCRQINQPAKCLNHTIVYHPPNCLCVSLWSSPQRISDTFLIAACIQLFLQPLLSAESQSLQYFGGMDPLIQSVWGSSIINDASLWFLCSFPSEALSHIWLWLTVGECRYPVVPDEMRGSDLDLILSERCRAKWNI